MATKISFNINNSRQVREAITQLQAYKNSLDYKLADAVDRLIELGVNVAVIHTESEYGSLIRFSKELNSVTNHTVEAFLIGEDVTEVVRSWSYKGGVKTVSVSPLLMSEFGSGMFAENPLNVSGVGRGTFPEQKHAFETSWWWQDPDTNERHTSSGFIPTQPMFNARNEMMVEIARVFSEVFGN